MCWVFVLFPAVCSGQAVPDAESGDESTQVDRFAVQVGDAYGYADRQGKVVISPQFYWALDHRGGLGAVIPRKSCKSGYVDSKGAVAIAPRFDEARSFSEGRAAVRVGEFWGYIDKTGAFVDLPRFAQAEEFREGRALVAVGGERDDDGYLTGAKFGYVGRDAKFAIPAEFENANGFSEGLAFVESEAKRGYIDRSGKLVISAAGYSDCSSFSCGLAAVSQDNRYGYIDKTGDLAIAFRFARAEPFSEDLASVFLLIPDEDRRVRAYIDPQGRIVFAHRFTNSGQFHDGLACVQLGEYMPWPVYRDEWGYIDRQGKLAVKAMYNEVTDFSNGVARVHQGGVLTEQGDHLPPSWEGGEWRLIDVKGTTLFPQPSEADP